MIRVKKITSCLDEVRKEMSNEGLTDALAEGN